MRRIVSVLSAAALMAAMLALVQGPAMAQSFNFDHHNNFDNGFFNNNGFGGFEQDIGDTGDVNISTRISSAGNNSNQCVAPLQFGNTGNLQNLQELTQFDSFADDIDFDGSSFFFDPEQTLNCGQAVKQSAASSSW